MRSLSCSILLICAASALPLPVAAQSVPVWTAQGSRSSEAFVQAPVKSWKAMKFDSVVRQETDFSCGAAALATVFKYGLGKTTTEQHVLVNMMKVADPEVVKEKGFSLLDMKNYVKAIGLRGEGYEVKYDALSQLQVPAIVLLNIKNYKHFVVIRKAGPDVIQVADPALGNRTMSRPAFEKAWNGVVFAVLGAEYDQRTALLNPPPPLSARRLFDQRAVLPTADPADFGIAQAGSFTF